MSSSLITTVEKVIGKQRLSALVHDSFPAPVFKKGKHLLPFFSGVPGSLNGAIAKRLCPGLQIRLDQFDSGSRLHPHTERPLFNGVDDGVKRGRFVLGYRRSIPAPGW